MSQIKFTSTYKGHEVEVLAGWDRPLSHYFLTVFDLDPDAEGETLWSTLDTVLGGGVQTIGPLCKQLFTMGIQEPDGFWERVELREGNVFHTYRDGNWVRQEF